MARLSISILLLLAFLLPGSATAAATGAVEGIVTHEGRPVQGAVVRVGEHVRSTGADGRFRFDAIAVSGDYKLVDVVMRAKGHGVWRLEDARVFPNDTLRITAELERDPVTTRQPKPATPSRTVSTAGGSYPAAVSGSQTTPPGAIRVYVTDKTGKEPGTEWSCPKDAFSNPPKGEVRVVPFDEYVRHVLPNEWFASWPRESLRAGAMAAKSYAWYQINRGGKWPQLGADVMDNTCDQVYNPAVSYASTDQAVADTWHQRITRDGYIHISQYWAGTPDDGSKPAADSPYYGRMSQWGSEYWAQRGKTWDWVLLYYYDGTVISPTTDADVRLLSGITASATAVWGEPFTARFTVKNYGTQSLQLDELYIRMRGPSGQNFDLGGDGNSDPIAPGETRTIIRRVPALASTAPGVFGKYTLTATYRDPSGLISPGLPPGEEGTRTTAEVSVVAPAYAATVESVSASAPRYYEGRTRDVTLRLRNTGNATWYRNPTATHNGVRLATALPALRESRFYVADKWLSPSRIAMTESLVRPGAVGTFTIRLGGTVDPGTYSEPFRPRVDGSLAGVYRGMFGPTTTLSPTVLPDTTPPTATVTAPEYSTDATDGLPFPVSWSGIDRESGIAGYEVQWLDGTYTTWLRGTTRRSATFGGSSRPTTVTPGRSYVFRVRATDRAGNIGAWSKRARVVVPADSATLTYQGSWSRMTGSASPHFLRTVHYARSSTERLVYQFRGRKVAWIGNLGPDKGKASVWIDGKRVAIVDLYSKTYVMRAPVFELVLGPTNESHTLVVRVLGTHNAASTGTRVDIDGIAVVR